LFDVRCSFVVHVCSLRSLRLRCYGRSFLRSHVVSRSFYAFYVYVVTVPFGSFVLVGFRFTVHVELPLPVTETVSFAFAALGLHAVRGLFITFTFTFTFVPRWFLRYVRLFGYVRSHGPAFTGSTGSFTPVSSVRSLRYRVRCVPFVRSVVLRLLFVRLLRLFVCSPLRFVPVYVCSLRLRLFHVHRSQFDLCSLLVAGLLFVPVAVTFPFVRSVTPRLPFVDHVVRSVRCSLFVRSFVYHTFVTFVRSVVRSLVRCYRLFPQFRLLFVRSFPCSFRLVVRYVCYRSVTFPVRSRSFVAGSVVVRSVRLVVVCVCSFV